MRSAIRSHLLLVLLLGASCGVSTQVTSSAGGGDPGSATRAAPPADAGTPVAPAVEQCGNGIDDDCDGVIDNGCTCIGNPSNTSWQIHAGAGPTCWPQMFNVHGDTREYQYSSIPGETDPGWAPHAAPTISFNDRSTMCGAAGAPDLCACLGGGDFTYFQTFFDIPVGYHVTSMVVSIANVDDGVRVTLFNSAYPGGVVGGHAFLGGGSTSDFAADVAPGKNRIVLTHVDDCCSERRIANASITLNGSSLQPCP